MKTNRQMPRIKDVMDMNWKLGHTAFLSTPMKESYALIFWRLVMKGILTLLLIIVIFMKLLYKSSSKNSWSIHYCNSLKEQTLKPSKQSVWPKYHQIIINPISNPKKRMESKESILCKLHTLRAVQIGCCITCSSACTICETKGCIKHH